MENARQYLKPGGRLVIVDPDRTKMSNSEHILSRQQILDFGRQSGYAVIKVDDSFLKSHMIIVLQNREKSDGKYGTQANFAPRKLERRSILSEILRLGEYRNVRPERNHSRPGEA